MHKPILWSDAIRTRQRRLGHRECGREINERVRYIPSWLSVTTTWGTIVSATRWPLFRMAAAERNNDATGGFSGHSGHAMYSQPMMVLATRHRHQRTERIS